ncbi:SDR family NAD(P)-dependent oxidoreductase [Caulobacter sp. 17J80-11]|uniref:SDR family NAD(P)-dependent oxidoreductase n=1 Tax=Caulobacter sp. 17J80-11 TaxID=2763502 RepID=UPI0016537E50|nr:glucose 1-dehydrogenase [Caulobacter sp. 17J80-11]MBC6983421.1 glucose 1-dehydrogenase [Caulobacter sp. 17J80-11]
MSLQGKVAIVTGGGRDIGRAVSIKLAQEGAKVAINYMSSAAAAEETASMVRAAGGECLLVQGDMTRAADVDALVDATRQAWGDEIHVLANVAGGLVARKTLSDMDEAFFDHVMALNLKSTFLATRAVAPFVPAGGAIVNVASIAGRDGGGPGASIYATSKGAVITFTRAMAKELGPRGVRVNSVCPGMISTTFHDTFSKDEVRKAVAAATPLRREGQAEEVAALVSYLASDGASFINGANLDINGGLLFS